MTVPPAPASSAPFPAVPAGQPCGLCGGACAGSDLTALLSPNLTWLWKQVAAIADRRGDPQLQDGPTLTVRIPQAAAERAAAAGLLGTRPLLAGQRRKVSLDALTSVLAARAKALTPGAVAAHATGRPLAQRAQERLGKDAAIADATAVLVAAVEGLPEHVRARIGDTGDTLASRLRTAGWFTRLLREPDPGELLRQAIAVAGQLPEPGRRKDRRTLVPNAPHALDGGPLPSLVLTLLRERDRGRAGWANVGVDCDELMGGLIVTGVLPEGWIVPAGVTVTLPPRELADIRWQRCPAEGEWVFVTENPSVLTAAAALVTSGPADVLPRVVCTVGTPSTLECEAIGALRHAGWQVAVRADFDTFGLAHMRAIIDKTEGAHPWRMATGDYLDLARPLPTSEARGPRQSRDHVSADLWSLSPWDPNLAQAMHDWEPVFEEELLPLLLADVAAGRPGESAAMPARR